MLQVKNTFIKPYEFQRRNNTNALAKADVVIVYERTCRKLISHFKKGNFSLKDEWRRCCPRRLDCEALEASVKANPTAAIRELTRHFKVRNMNVQYETEKYVRVIKG